MDTSDPIAIVSGIMLILVVILILFTLLCVARRSAKDVWSEHHRQSLKAKQRPIAEWRASLKHQVQAQWQRENEEAAHSKSQSPSRNQPYITTTAPSPSRLPPALTIGRSDQLDAVDADAFLEDPAPRTQSAFHRSQRKRPTVQGWNPLRCLPKFFFEDRKYTHVPYFEGDDSGIELEAQFNQSRSTHPYHF